MWYYSHDPYEIVIFGQLWRRKRTVIEPRTTSIKPKLPTKYISQRKPKRNYFAPNPGRWVMTWSTRGAAHVRVIQPGRGIYTGQVIDHQRKQELEKRENFCLRRQVPSGRLQDNSSLWGADECMMTTYCWCSDILLRGNFSKLRHFQHFLYHFFVIIEKAQTSEWTLFPSISQK